MNINKLKDSYSVITVGLVANMLPDQETIIREAKAALLIEKFRRTNGIFEQGQRTVKYPVRHKVNTYRISPSAVDIGRRARAEHKQTVSFKESSIYATLKRLISRELR